MQKWQRRLNCAWKLSNSPSTNYIWQANWGFIFLMLHYWWVLLVILKLFTFSWLVCFIFMCSDLLLHFQKAKSVIWINSPYPWLIDINSVHQVGINGWFVMFTKVLTTKLLQVIKHYNLWSFESLPWKRLRVILRKALKANNIFFCFHLVVVITSEVYLDLLSLMVHASVLPSRLRLQVVVFFKGRH